MAIRANLFRNTGRVSQARADISAAIAVKPEAWLFVRQAQYREKADTAGRLADLDLALKLDPRFVPALDMRTRIEAVSGKTDLAVASLTPAIAAAPKSASLLVLRGWANAEGGRMDKALTDFAADRANSGANAGELNRLCWEEASFPTLLATALADCDASIKLDPLDPAALDSRAFVLLRMGRLDDALAGYNRVLTLRPRQAPSIFGRGIVKLKKGMTKEGEADLTLARLIDPTAPDVLADKGVTP